MKATQVRHCEDCEITFQVYERRARPKYFCPVCGDNIAVIRHKSHRTGENVKGKGTKPRWTAEELAVLEQVISGKLPAYTAARRIGRSANSVCHKVRRILKERGKSK